jgi:hypothetical protein
VGGLDSTAGEHLSWLKAELRPGDVVTIRVIDSDCADAPSERRQEDPEALARSERRYYEELKKRYGE